MKKILKFLSSMKFALILLLILAAACMGGSFIPQGQSYEWYSAQYSQTGAAAIILFELDDVFHCWWFVLITLFLCLNLLFCNVIRFPALVKQWRVSREKEQVIPAAADTVGRLAVEKGSAEETLLVYFRKAGFSKMKKTAIGNSALYYASKNRIGMWGAWVCHLGILVLILGFGLGQMTKEEYAVYGVPGQSKPVGDTSYILTIDDFQIDLRDDDTVEQYTASLTVRDARNGTSQNGTVSVNHPKTMYGMKFYQNSTGWAADISVLKGGKEIQRETVCAGEYMEVADKEGLVVFFSTFYPDYYRDESGNMQTLSGTVKNPAYLYRVYYQNQVIGMNVLMADEEITIDEYTVRFSDPQPYTLIQVKRDRFAFLALAGGLLVLFGLLLAFYLQPRSLWAKEEENGFWQIYCSSRKGGALYLAACREAFGMTGEEHEQFL